LANPDVHAFPVAVVFAGPDEAAHLGIHITAVFAGQASGGTGTLYQWANTLTSYVSRPPVSNVSFQCNLFTDYRPLAVTRFAIDNYKAGVGAKYKAACHPIRLVTRLPGRSVE
jgi:hypothetical protein